MAHTFASTPTVFPYAGFDASSDSAVLREAMAGRGCNKAVVTKILAKRSNGQRREIAKAYAAKFDRKLSKDLESELSGGYRRLMLALLSSPSSFLAQQLHDAMAGVGTDEAALIQILCSRDTAQLRPIVDAYQKKYKSLLLDKVRGETSGDFQHLLCRLLTITRKSSSDVDVALAKLQAKALMQAGALKRGTDEEGFTRLMTTESYAQLRAVFEEYRTLSHKTIEEACKSELSGDYRDAVLAIVQTARNVTVYYAMQLNDSMSGLGTKEASLVRLIVSHAETDLGAIKSEFEKLYSKTLINAVKKNTSGEFEDALVMLLG